MRVCGELAGGVWLGCMECQLGWVWDGSEAGVWVWVCVLRLGVCFCIGLGGGAVGRVSSGLGLSSWVGLGGVWLFGLGVWVGGGVGCPPFG